MLDQPAWWRGPECDTGFLAVPAKPTKIDRMSTVTMNISLTDDLKVFVDTRVKTRGYSSTSEYMSDLVRRDEERAELITRIDKARMTPTHNAA